nr:uncharacterized protein LOC125623372 [Caretta caretta]
MTFYTSEHSGLGISETVSLRTFKPFFVEPALPYSVIRGESFPLKVKVFSYLTQCMGIQLSLKDSGDFEFVQSNVEFTACLCPDLAKTFSWDEKATKLGRGTARGEHPHLPPVPEREHHFRDHHSGCAGGCGARVRESGHFHSRRHHGNSTAEHRRPPADVRWMQRAEHMVRFAPNVFITRYLEETGQRSNRKLLASLKAVSGSEFRLWC